MNLLVRVAEPDDLAELLEIVMTGFYSQATMSAWLAPILRWGLSEGLKQRIQGVTPNHIVLVAIAVGSASGSDKIVGVVEVTFRATHVWQLFQPYYPYLSNLAVRLDYRRQGVAQALLGQCEVRVRQTGLDQLYLHVLEENHSARQLYLKSGYEPHKVELLYDCWLLGRSSRLLLRKPLASRV